MVAKLKELLVVIVGETASGKSEAALKVAKQFNGEIVSADSWTVYKDFDIGTAKPSKAERRLIKHHLLDVANPRDGYNAAIFKREATKRINEILKRGKLPVIVGGTGLYLDSLIYDYSFLPDSNVDVRSSYNSMSLGELRQLVSKLGYDTTDIDMSNKRRIIRLIENKGKRPVSKPMREDVIIFGIQLDRSKLETNIQKRVDTMFSNGLENEVKTLAKKYGWSIEPMKGIGYREFKDYFEGSITIDDVKKRITQNSLNLAKKQRTWFKRNKSIQWVSNSSKIVDILTTHLNK
jgi:tRNA dimethylallyltransferase